jgi:predicted N-acetyltransferase YhbS
MHHAHAERLVAERDGTVVATVLVDRSIDPWVIVDLDVATSARRTGVGRRLASELLVEAARPVELEAEPLRPAAVPFWIALGFEPVGPGVGPGALRLRWSPPPAARPTTG